MSGLQDKAVQASDEMAPRGRRAAPWLALLAVSAGAEGITFSAQGRAWASVAHIASNQKNMPILLAYWASEFLFRLGHCYTVGNLSIYS